MGKQDGRSAGLAARLTVAAAIVGATGLAVVVLHQRAGAGASADLAPPMPVLAAPLPLEPGYAETRRFAGRLEPARATGLGFERAGKLIEVLAREGDTVAAGAPLARLDPETLLNERDRLAAARDAQAAVVELARLTDGRQAGLQDNAVSGQRRDEARLARAQAEAQLAATDAALDGIAIDIAKSELRAPFAGQIAARRADEGAIVAAGAPVLELMETSAPRARVGIAPEVAAELALGESYTLTQRGRPFAAALAALGPDLDPASRTVVALFDLAPATGLAFGDIVEFAWRAWRPEPGYWLPMSALAEAERGLWSVLTVEEAPDGRRVAREAVRVVLVEGERAFVSGAIPEGVAVIRDGVHRVIPGQAIRLASEGE